MTVKQTSNLNLELFYTTDCLFKAPIVLDEPDQLDKSKCIYVIMKVDEGLHAQHLRCVSNTV